MYITKQLLKEKCACQEGICVTWKPLRNYENYYLINNLGDIYALGKIKKDKLNRTYKLKPKYLKKSISKTGYYKVILTVNKVPKYFKLHRLLAETFIPNPANLPFVNHINGNKLDNNLNNLEWVTPKENILHALRNNLLSRDKNGKFAKIP